MTNRIPLGPFSALVATFFFSINDVTIKFLSGDYALHEIVLVRSLVGLSVLLVLIVPLGGGFRVLRTRRIGMHLIRGACVVFANTTFFLGLSVLPLADAVAVFFVSPLIITAMSAIFLREHIGPRRLIAVAAGMVGVLIMISPGAGAFNVALLLPFLAAFAYGTLHILTRKIGDTESAATMAVYIQIVFILVSSCVGITLGHGDFAEQGGAMIGFLLRGWVWPASMDWPLLILLGVSSAGGGFFISQAYRISEASLIAPLEYAAMPMAVIFGVLVFGEWPEPSTWVGMVLIIGAGLFVFWREARTRQPTQPNRPRTRR
ncbi:DMT family transporter [Shimia sp.]|uniref:DMT family transporter n=1 Tax=Shimia sp. TaxID=1954381 RepID=UPI003297D258